MRVRLSSTNSSSPIPLIATTATLREGAVKEGIFDTLAIDPARHHFIRRSNWRREIRIVVREMQSAASAAGFRELEWVLSSQRNTVIFCRTIGLATRISTHLLSVGIAKKLPDLDSRIRTFTAVNWASQNASYLQTLNDNPHATITIATDVLSVGWDNRYIQDVIIYGEPDNIDDFVQKIGRAGRDRNEVSDPRAILYVSKHAKAAAAKAVEGVEASLNRPSTPCTNKASNANEPPMDISIAKLILALCYPAEIDTQYGNQLNEPLCSCMQCQQHHTTSAKPTPSCNCSGCKPEDPSEYQLVVERVRRARAKRGQGISKEMEVAGMKRFASLRKEVFQDARKKDTLANVGFLPPQAFLSNTLAKAIIKKIYYLDTKERVDDVVKGTELEGFSEMVYDVCVEVREMFETIRAAAKAEKAGNGGRTGQEGESEGDEDED
ncbi:hypothetical protein FA13DRAFT_1713043 [Coprinellus micaceus]|uniref:DNA 3'-5' helicase n=1 Tax=Coprinellus micaceus TaxID=71717 RepID=A0A4Y7SXU5_COPMI|nr:hypothetical protein FA13DRAFT_1713043 [Coprinellus micaceus]